MSQLRRSSWFLGVGVLPVLALAWTGWGWPRDTAGPEPVAAAVCAPGLTEPTSQVVELRATRPGRLVAVHGTAGARVTAGQVVAELAHDAADAAVALRRAELAAAEARLARLEVGARVEDVAAAQAAHDAAQAEVDGAAARLAELEAGARAEDLESAHARVAEAEARATDAVRNAERRRRMLGTGAVERALVDDADTAQATAAARLRQARAELALLEHGARAEQRQAARAALATATARCAQAAAEWARLRAGARVEELAEARAQVEAARAQVTIALADREDCCVRSPLTGVVVYRFAHPGEQASPHDPRPLLEVAAPLPMQVRVDVDEFDVARVHVGQAVWATAPAFGEQRFPGRVVRIEATLGRKNFRTDTATEKQDAKVLEVLVALDPGAADTLPLAMPMRVWFAAEGARELPPGDR